MAFWSVVAGLAVHEILTDDQRVALKILLLGAALLQLVALLVSHRNARRGETPGATSDV